jgi:hypothetical protein
MADQLLAPERLSAPLNKRRQLLVFCNPLLKLTSPQSALNYCLSATMPSSPVICLTCPPKPAESLSCVSRSAIIIFTPPQAEAGLLAAQLGAFFALHDPANMGRAADLARESLGREDQLNRKLRSKYGLDLLSFTSPMVLSPSPCPFPTTVASSKGQSGPRPPYTSRLRHTCQTHITVWPRPLSPAPTVPIPLAPPIHGPAMCSSINTHPPVVICSPPPQASVAFESAAKAQAAEEESARHAREVPQHIPLPVLSSQA